MEKSLSRSYRLLRSMGLKFSEEEYGQYSLWRMLGRALAAFRNSILLKYCMYSVLLGPLNYRSIRARFWRVMGCRVGKHVFIGYEVWMDFNHARLIEIEDEVHITNRCLLLCHYRNLDNYYQGDDSSKLPYTKRGIVLKKGCHIGMGTIILPGVTVGEGAIVGAGSVITRDIPAWTIAKGNPAKVSKQILRRQDEHPYL